MHRKLLPLRRSARRGLLALGVAAGLLTVAAVGEARADVAMFTSAGEQPPFTVPAGVTSLHVVAVGGRGGIGHPGSPAVPGGFGARATADLAVTPGQVLYVEVAGNGGDASGATAGPAGINGGAVGGSSGDITYPGGGGGGGASDIRSLPMFAGASSLVSRLIAAAGGGGASGSGSAGGAAGADGQLGGKAGTSTLGGTGGTPNGSMGTLGVGGAGGSVSSQTGGGGGGGGSYGGGGGGSFGGGSGGGGGGSSAFAASVTNASVEADASGVPSVTFTYTVGQTTAPLAAVSGLAFSNKTFAAEASGPSAYVVRKKAPRGTKVSFKLNEAAKVRFTVTQRVKGRKVKKGKKTACVKPTRKNRKKKSCTRVVTLKGRFTRTGAAGKNSFHFTGRLNRRKLKPGRYRLVATPTAGGKRGKPTSSRFRIVR
jgi:hypothetical protein